MHIYSLVHMLESALDQKHDLLKYKYRLLILHL